MRTQHIYMLGLIPAGLAYYQLKAAVDGPIMLVIVVVYLIALSLLAKRFSLSRLANQPASLIQVLLDRNAESGDRGDAAMDLGAFDEEVAEEALAQVACDEDADDDLADSCGESLAEIWCRRGRVTTDILDRLTPVSRKIAMATMEGLCPALAASFR